MITKINLFLLIVKMYSQIKKAMCRRYVGMFTIYEEVWDNFNV
jgi:hypothetical protein